VLGLVPRALVGGTDAGDRIRFACAPTPEFSGRKGTQLVGVLEFWYLPKLKFTCVTARSFTEQERAVYFGKPTTIGTQLEFFMRKVFTSLSLFATANVTALLSLACTGADNSSGPPEPVFSTPAPSIPIASAPVNSTVQPNPTVFPVTSTATTSTAPTSTVATSTAASSTVPSATSSATAAPTSSDTGVVVNPGTTSDETDEDTETSGGNPNGLDGIPIDEDGYFPANSNKMGFQGSWYCFADEVNETSCVQDEPPWDEASSSMCLTGTTTVRTDPEDYSAWGAGIGASLNDVGGSKKAFDAEAKNIKGFKFTVTGDFDGATLQLLAPLTSKDTEDGPPEYNMTKPGTYSVEFDEIVRPEWTDSEEAANASELYALKWQIKGGDTASSYSFCISEVEPL
jgi:hypothetical protein